MAIALCFWQFHQSLKTWKKVDQLNKKIYSNEDRCNLQIYNSCLYPTLSHFLSSCPSVYLSASFFLYMSLAIMNIVKTIFLRTMCFGCLNKCEIQVSSWLNSQLSTIQKLFLFKYICLPFWLIDCEKLNVLCHAHLGCRAQKLNNGCVLFRRYNISDLFV